MDQTISFGVKYRNVTHDLLHSNSMKTSKSTKKCMFWFCIKASLNFRLNQIFKQQKDTSRMTIKYLQHLSPFGKVTS